MYLSVCVCEVGVPASVLGPVSLHALSSVWVRDDKVDRPSACGQSSLITFFAVTLSRDTNTSASGSTRYLQEAPLKKRESCPLIDAHRSLNSHRTEKWAYIKCLHISRYKTGTSGESLRVVLKGEFRCFSGAFSPHVTIYFLFRAISEKEKKRLTLMNSSMLGSLSEFCRSAMSSQKKFNSLLFFFFFLNSKALPPRTKLSGSSHTHTQTNQQIWRERKLI